MSISGGLCKVSSLSELKADPVQPSERSNPELWAAEGLAEHGNRNRTNRRGKDTDVCTKNKNV